MVKANDKQEKEMFEKEFIRDVKKHIDAISKKYILPSEGTMDFALMYIPSESVYYEIVNQTDVLDYARRARVYMVSPSTLYAHLQTILLSFEGKKIESHTKELFTLLRSMQIDYEKIEENMSTLGKHINNAYSQFGNVFSGFSSLGQKLNSTKTLESKQKEIDKPA
jgi:DNA recombination protein RmuC